MCGMEVFMKVAAMLADGFEEGEALAVIDILRRAGIETTLVSIMGHREKVEGAHGITVIADGTLEHITIEKYDGIFLPGGMPGTNNLDACTELCDTLLNFANNGKIIAAICAAPKVLGRLGILNGKKAICYPGFEKELLGATISHERVVKDGNIFTSKGMGTAIDLGLALVAEIKSEGEAKEMAKGIQYI